MFGLELQLSWAKGTCRFLSSSLQNSLMATLAHDFARFVRLHIHAQRARIPHPVVPYAVMQLTLGFHVLLQVMEGSTWASGSVMLQFVATAADICTQLVGACHLNDLIFCQQLQFDEGQQAKSDQEMKQFKDDLSSLTQCVVNRLLESPTPEALALERCIEAALNQLSEADDEISHPALEAVVAALGIIRPLLVREQCRLSIAASVKRYVPSAATE